jgi:hypothetical protein
MTNSNPYTPPKIKSEVDSQSQLDHAPGSGWCRFRKRLAHEALASIALMNGLFAVYYWNSAVAITLEKLKGRHLNLAIGNAIVSIGFLVIAANCLMRHRRKSRREMPENKIN